MNQNSCNCKLISFAQTVQLVENYVRGEIIQETHAKQLLYHTITHAEAVKRRANLIFEGIRPVLATEYSSIELERLKSLLGISAIAHDMVQEFETQTVNSSPRKHLTHVSEIATAKKLQDFIKSLNQQLSQENCPISLLFNARDLEIIEDAIMATICELDPQAGKVNYSFSSNSIYQPYLYNPQPKISILGSILALADLGTLAIDGVESYIQDGILIFLEDNLDIENLLTTKKEKSSTKLKSANSHKLDNFQTRSIKERIMTMNKFMIDLAKERYARLDKEIAAFSPPARQILKEQIFTSLNMENINKIEAVLPTDNQTELSDLIVFLEHKFNQFLLSPQFNR